MNLKTIKTKLLSDPKWALIAVAVVIFATWYLGSSLADWQAGRATRARQQAEADAQAAEQRVEDLERQNAEKDREAQERELERQKQQDAFRQELERAQEAAATAAANARRAQLAIDANRETTRLAQAQVPSQTDHEIARAVSALALQAYPEVSRGFEIEAVSSNEFRLNRIGAEVLNRALIDTIGLRQDVNTLTEVSNQRAVQIREMETTVETQKGQIVNLELSIQDQRERLNRMDENLTVLRQESQANRQLANASQSELRAFKRAQKFKRVRSFVVGGAAIAGAFYAGRQLNK